MSGTPQLIEEIRARIAQRGPLPFRDVMDLALYHPEHGYYTSGRARIGRAGDYFTNVSVGPFFGAMLARVFEEMWERLGRPARFTLVEQGAHNEQFARDVLAAAPAEFAAAIDYVILERSAPSVQSDLPIRWITTLDELDGFTGAHFSNEFLDALPVHLIKVVGGEWRERCVDAQLEFVDAPIENARLRERISQLDLPSIDGYETEINLDALTWIDALSRKLERGYILAIDYGYTRDELYHPSRNRGTLTRFAAHRRSFDLLEALGESDLTAHVDFTSLADRALTCGFELTGFADQHHFTVALAKELFAKSPPTPKQARAFQTLSHPQMLGTVFKVLALQKKGSGSLSAFDFAKHAKGTLGL